MKDRLANQIASYRTRLVCLDKPEHRAVWENQPPLAFTAKVAEARALTDELVEMAARQATDSGGATAAKAAVRQSLLEAAHTLGRAVVVFSRDRNDESLAARYDQAPWRWKQMRDEALIQRARSLVEDAGALATGPDAAEAADYGITPEAVSALTAVADRFAEQIAAPQVAIAERSRLTAALPGKSREVRQKFAELDDLVIQFGGGGNPAGEAFVAAFRASRQIIDRGRGRSPEREDPPT